MLYSFEKHLFCLEPALSALFEDLQIFDESCQNTKSTNLLESRHDRLKQRNIKEYLILSKDI